MKGIKHALSFAPGLGIEHVSGRPEGTSEAIILLGHGSREQTSMDAFQSFVSLYRAEDKRAIYFGFLELSSPSIPEVIDRAVGDGATHLWVLPLFLFPGRHILCHIPQILEEQQKRHPNVVIYYGKAICSYPQAARLLAVMVREGLQAALPIGGMR